MTIGTANFHARTLEGFQRLNTEIAGLQTQISEGRNDPRPSADPVRAQRLSAATEQRERLDRFSANIDTASGRLDLADSTLGTAADILQRLQEIALRGASDGASPGERSALATEARELRQSLIGTANSRDATGRALFGGFNGETDPYSDAPGGVVYEGNLGRPRLRISESAMLETGLTGPDVFGDPGAPQGSTFDTIDRLIARLETPGETTRDMIGEMSAAADRIADSRARIGALGNVAERQGAAIEARRVALDGVIAGLDELDLAAATTQLQKRLLTRDAAQLTFVKIAQSNLFDYIR